MTSELRALAAALAAKKSDSDTAVATISVACDGYATAEIVVRRWHGEKVSEEFIKIGKVRS